MDFGFYHPPEENVVSFWIAHDMNPSLTVTGNWLTEDYLFWMDVWEFDAVMEEEAASVRRELKQARKDQLLYKDVMADDAIDGGEFS